MVLGGRSAGGLSRLEFSVDEEADDVFAPRTLEVEGVPCFHLRIFKPMPENDGAY